MSRPHEGRDVVPFDDGVPEEELSTPVPPRPSARRRLWRRLFPVTQRYAGTELNPKLLTRGLGRPARERALARLRRLPCFNPAEYLDAYRDIANAGMDPHFHALFIGGFEERTLFRAETLASCLGAPLPAWPALPPGPARHVGVYVSSRGNLFMREIAEDVAEGLRAAGARVDLLDETAPVEGRPPACLFIAPHEFFSLGQGAVWAREDVVAGAIMLNTEQPQTRWFGRGLPFLLAARGIFDLCPQAAALFAAAGVPSRAIAPAPPLAIRPLTDEERRHPLFRVLPKAAKADADPRTPFAARALDVVFFGSESRHREEWFARQAGLLAGFECVIHYRREDRGPIRDGTLTRIAQHASAHAKLALNLHRDAFGYVEWHRVARQALATGAVLVSETSLPHPLLTPGVHYFEDSARRLPGLIEWLLRSEDGARAAAAVQARARALLTETITPAATGADVLAFLHAHAGAA